MQWSKTCKERSFVGTELIELAEQYKSLDNHPAWTHFNGLLWGVKAQLETGILKGTYDGSEDMTHHLRSAYGIILQILALPEQIKDKTLMAEYEIALSDDLQSPE